MIGYQVQHVCNQEGSCSPSLLSQCSHLCSHPGKQPKQGHSPRCQTCSAGFRVAVQKLYQGYDMRSRLESIKGYSRSMRNRRGNMNATPATSETQIQNKVNIRQWGETDSLQQWRCTYCQHAAHNDGRDGRVVQEGQCNGEQDHDAFPHPGSRGQLCRCRPHP